MKYSKIFSMMTLAVIASLIIMVAVPPVPALAQSITLSPASGFRGTKVTVTGTDFESYANSDVYIYFGDNKLGNVKVADNGTFTTDFNVPIYATPATSHNIIIKNESGTTLTEAWFIVGAKIDLDPPEAQIDDVVEIGGRYFDADEEVRLYFSSDNANVGDYIDSEVTAYEYIGAVSTDYDGNLESPYLFEIPSKLTDGANDEDVSSGDYYIYATYLSSGKRINAVATLPIVSETQLEPITLSPSSGFQGSLVTVTGTGFESYANNYVYLYFGENRLKNIKVSDNGTFTTDFNVPTYAAAGTSHDVTIQNEEGDTLAEASFAVGAKIILSVDEGEIDNWIQISGKCFDANETINLYFSSDNANVDDSIDSEVVVYEIIGEAFIDGEGYFVNPCHFSIPKELTNGEEQEYVHGGEYYVYATYLSDSDVIAAWTIFNVIGVGIDPAEGSVGTMVTISSEDIGSSQEVTIKYDEDPIEILSSNGETPDGDQSTWTITIPESVVGDHIITVANEYHKKYQAVFTVEPTITITPTAAIPGDTIKFSGTGFEAPYYPSDYITITLEDDEITTEPSSISASSSGSFNGTFVIPLDFVPDYGDNGTVAAIDSGLNSAEAKLTIINTEAAITLEPSTSQTAPGYADMELTADGIWFTPNAEVTITYDSEETITLATAIADEDGNFSVTFLAPSSNKGEHTITCTDGTNTATSVFTMESEAPLKPELLGPEITDIEESKAYFDWEDVDDPSGVTYTFQVASDANFKNIVLEEIGLTNSEYAITEETNLTANKDQTSFYWRVRAVDGASNESEWTLAKLLSVDPSQTSSPKTGIGAWMIPVSIGLGAVALVILILAWRSAKKYR